MKTSSAITSSIRHHVRLYGACMMWVLALMLSGCGKESGESPDIALEKDISVSIEIAGRIPDSSRASLSEDDGFPAESYIDIGDIYVLAFSTESAGGIANGESLLKDIIWSPVESERLPDSKIFSNGTRVLLSTFLDSGKGYSVSQPFSIVTIANAKKWLADGENFVLEKGVTKLSDLQRRLDYTKVLDGNYSWIPDNTKKTGIPMFGVMKASLEYYNNTFNGPANPYGLGTVWLLRSLAKVEIEIEDPNIEIESARIEAGNWSTTSQLIPFSKANGAIVSNLNRMEDFATSGNTGQVTKTPDFTSDANFGPVAGTQAIFLKEIASKVGTTQNQVLTAYLPEFPLRTPGGSPKCRLCIKVKNVKPECHFYIAPYGTNGIVDSAEIYWHYLLRNYKYRFVIKDLDDVVLNLKWTVCPISEKEIDIPAFN